MSGVGGPDWDALESPLAAPPEFLVEGPDGRKDLPELERQKTFVSWLRKKCPHIVVCAIPNAGKRGQKAMNQARAEGMVLGAFDTFIAWDYRQATSPDCPRSIAFIEWKGYEASGRAGKLSQAQIDFGNSLHRKGHAVACFFSARSAVEWLRGLGAPIMGTVA